MSGALRRTRTESESRLPGPRHFLDLRHFASTTLRPLQTINSGLPTVAVH